MKTFVTARKKNVSSSLFGFFVNIPSNFLSSRGLFLLPTSGTRQVLSPPRRRLPFFRFENLLGFNSSTPVSNDVVGSQETIEEEEKKDSSTTITGGERDVEKLITMNAASIEKINTLQDKLLRSLAESENARQRHSKELDNTRQYSVTKFALGMLDVADNLSLALAHIDPTSLEINPDVKKIYDGIKMTESVLSNVFQNFGIEKFDSLGQAFDPKYHEALFQVDDPSKSKGTITQVLQTGYTINGRLLRAAKVGCSRGGNNFDNGNKIE